MADVPSVPTPSARSAFAEQSVPEIAGSAATFRTEALRTEVLPDGRTLIVRPITPGDRDALTALYATLPSEDRRRRFFTGSRPPKSFLNKWTTMKPDKGAVIVAVVSGPGGGQLIAEAGYVKQADGDGELGITVSPEWRGWLGPYLLDALIELAASLGVPNIQAEVLVGNGPMLATLRARGLAVIDHPDWTVVRVVVGTAGRVPTWPAGNTRPRVLVEGGGGSWRAEKAARSAGMQVIACPGPKQRGTSGCPVLQGLPCPLAAGADAIVVTLPASDPNAAALLSSHPRLHSRAALFDDVHGGDVHDDDDETRVGDAGGERAPTRLTACATPTEVAALLWAAIGHSEHTPPVSSDHTAPVSGEPVP